ncbi:MAG: NAD(P)H-dependent oxidoreductase [Burkholderiaceae bacterium]|nr:NAD(P)H-dependent oxidoreductase [Sulfuritalea sp.]MCF8176195.1 NAD(P)H-dependent oxidoreductase [Burkholderiaceae bacterium]MCF8183551.1 NAD(P)H-dependent oxidoreductase [Polynucleobacter sp.]
MKVRLLAFCGSARKESHSRRLLAAAVTAARASGAAVTELELCSDLLPMYDGDLEAAHGLPAAALELKALFADHDGFLIASPEYNGFFPPLLKNTLDWVSRPAPDMPAPYAGKSAGLLAASPGALGGVRCLPHLRLLLSNLGVTVSPAQLALGRADQAFAGDGSLIDAGQQKMLDTLVADLIRLTAAIKT